MITGGVSVAQLQRGLGHIPELPDDRDEDFDLFGVGTVPPPTFMEMESFYLPESQEKTESCTGFSTRQGSRIWQLANLGEIIVDPSALGAYYNGRVFHRGQKDRDAGAHLRSVFRGYNAYGIVADKDWPFDPSMVNVRPGHAAELGAYRHRKVQYRKIYATGDGKIDRFRKSIASKRPMIFGIPVYDNFLRDDGPTHIELPDAALEAPVGWHAIEGHGYKTDTQGRFWLRIGNSWGDWREAGCAWMSAEYLRRAVDCWSIELIGRT